MKEGKGTALVTGAAIRVGREIALTLAEHGYDIALHYNTSHERAEETARDILELGVRCELFPCDLGDLEETTALIPRVVEQFGDMCVLINNASIYEACHFLETDLDLFARHMTINLGAPFFLSRDFALHVERGVIVNIGDTHVTRLRSKHFAYLMSKKSLMDLTAMTAHLLGPEIRVNAVCPGLTELHESLDSATMKRKIDMLPLRRVSPIRDIADAVLTAVVSEYMTGQTLFVDGGEHVIY